jgi:hypothetical protein|tara:strand:+ start:219 stop:380 length:162 start_codon:yes stop_codon:yes gene_type:complete
MEESHHNNKYIIELFSIKLGTKKHQLNGVELTFTAIEVNKLGITPLIPPTHYV